MCIAAGMAVCMRLFAAAMQEERCRTVCSGYVVVVVRFLETREIGKNDAQMVRIRAVCLEGVS